MSMNDPVADMLTRIRNGQGAKHQNVQLASSTLKVEIARVLKEEGYINDYSVETTENNFRVINIALKYYSGKPVIERITRISRPGLRVYKSAKNLTQIPGFGISIISTSQGVMSHHSARAKGIGGEIICEVA